MITTCAWCMIHDMSLVLPWSYWRLAHGIANTLGTAGGSIGKVIPFLATGILARPEPRSFLIIADRIHLHYLTFGGDHVFIETHAISMGIAPVHICLSIVVNPYSGIDVRPMFLSPYERFADRVFERAEWRVGNEHTDTISVNGTIHIPFAVALNHMFCPSAIVTFIPLEVAQ